MVNAELQRFPRLTTNLKQSTLCNLKMSVNNTNLILYNSFVQFEGFFKLEVAKTKYNNIKYSLLSLPRINHC